MPTSDLNLDPPPSPKEPGSLSPWRQEADHLLAGAIESTVLALACLSPWVFDWVGTKSRLGLAVGIAVLLVMWGARLLLQGRLVWQKCPLALCLALGFLAGIAQLTTLPPGVLDAVAPGTASYYTRVLPAIPEVLPDGAITPSRARRTLSLDAHATRARVMDLLAIFLLFAVVRNNLSPTSGLRRFSLAATANGALLGLFVMAQAALPGLARISNELGDEVGVWGPFLQRAHLGGYLGVSVGLALGSIVGSVTAPDRPGSRCRVWMSVSLAAGLALMLGGLAFCYSSADLLAVSVPVFFGCLILMRVQPRTRVLAIGSLACVAGLAAVLVVESGAIIMVSWSRIFAYAQEFPLWGTGLGTFPQVASNRGFEADRTPGGLVNASTLQVLVIEAGALGVMLTLLAIGVIFRQGYQAYRVARTNATVGLAFGALVGITTLLVHGLFTASLQNPALIVLATVLGAYLCGLANANEERKPDAVARSTISSRLFGLGGPAGMIILLFLAAALVSNGLRNNAVAQHSQAAVQLRRADDAAGRQQRVQYLQAAVQLAPEDVRIRLELADAHHQVLEMKRQRLHSATVHMEAALLGQAVAASGRLPADTAAGNLMLLWWLPMNWQNVIDEKKAYLEKQHLNASLLSYLEARNASPLHPESHLRLAYYARHLQKADRSEIYIARAKWIAPANPWVFYQSGLVETKYGAPSQAQESWRNSLELSDGYLTAILDRCRDDMTVNEMLQRLLAARPQQLISAAIHLFPDPLTARKQGRPLFERALALLREQQASSAKDYYLAATAHGTLGHITEGRVAFEKALNLEPRQISWRFEYAGFLYHAEDFAEAEKQLLTILMDQPRHQRTVDLLRQIKNRVID